MESKGLSIVDAYHRSAELQLSVNGSRATEVRWGTPCVGVTGVQKVYFPLENIAT
jgi:hypothetical protein